jgi:DNA modification methylase
VTPWLELDGVTVFHGDCIEVMRELPDNSVHAVVTDPPYGLGFMGKLWDSFENAPTAVQGGNYEPPAPNGYIKKGSRGLSIKDSAKGNLSFQLWFTDVATEALRILKPGGHLLAFGGTRTWHRLAVAIEDAGFEVRDSVAWMYGSGFPKSLDVSKAIDKRAGAEREVVGSKVGLPGYSLAPSKHSGTVRFGGFGGDGDPEREAQITAPATPAAEQWQGWGTALKPAHEPIVVARKPLIGTVAENVLTHGTGALNIDGCRIAGEQVLRVGNIEKSEADQQIYGRGWQKSGTTPPAGRWPANVILDESQAGELDKQSGDRPAGAFPQKSNIPTGQHYEGGWGAVDNGERRNMGTGGASRFFYVAKASKKERPNVDGVAHPTVKPMTLMRYLVRLITPPGGTVLEPFAGSGTTIEACVIEGFNCIAIEREADYLPLIEARLNRPIQGAL